MPRGGARPGAGRKAAPGSKRTKAAKAARAIAPGGVKPPEEKSWPFGAEPAPPAPEPPPAPDLSALTPLAYLLSVIRDPEESKSARMQAAALAAPYVHAKPAPLGKKDEKAKGSKVAAGGRFAAAAPPRLVSSR